MGTEEAATKMQIANIPDRTINNLRIAIVFSSFLFLKIYFFCEGTLRKTEKKAPKGSSAPFGALILDRSGKSDT
jgi:hypothetical protein